jgi:hypothetical protein
LQHRIQTTEQRIAELRSDLDLLDAERVSPQELKQALEAVDPIWQTLNTSEQSRIIRALVERVGYDGRTGKFAVTFRSAGFKTLCDGRRTMRTNSSLTREWKLEGDGRRSRCREETTLQSTPTGRLPRVTRLMALATKFEGMLRRASSPTTPTWRAWAWLPGHG